MRPDVTPEALRRELLRLGFFEYENEGRAGVTWASISLPDGPTVVVPREEDADRRGYAETIGSALQRLSWITGESASAVATRLIGGPDRIEMRIVHPLTEDHTVPLLQAPRVMASFVKLIKMGARARFAGTRAVHRGSGGDDYESAVASIRVLAPTPGSFRLVAVSAEAPQFAVERAATTRSRDALAATIRCVAALADESRSARELVDDDVERLVDSGVSIGLLAAVEGLAIAGTSGLVLEFQGRWDTTIGLPDAPTGAIALRDGHVSLARELRARLSAYEPIANYRLAGWATGTAAPDQSLEGFPAGTVVVRTRHEGRHRDVLVRLPQEHFPQVTAGFTELSMKGTLERISGRWHLLDPTDIDVTDPKRSSFSRGYTTRLLRPSSDAPEKKQIEPPGEEDDE